MSETKKSKGLAWILAIVFTVITVGMVFFIPEWSWVPLPFMLTYIVEATNII